MIKNTYHLLDQSIIEITLKIAIFGIIYFHQNIIKIFIQINNNKIHNNKIKIYHIITKFI